ncbi:MAG: 5'/3'-nucleotidase SurE, partial [Bacteroidales bacterium]|nr:5'/3'-nucleotidase SurE [Bacteroidales bacterium]
NDDGYKARGLEALIEIMRPFGEITVVAPKYHQSGMSMAISLGFKRIAVKQTAPGRWYLDGTPASCVKFGIDNILLGDKRPDVVVCGINHGSNAATASLYSGTLGAAQEAAVNGIVGIGVSLDDFSPEGDFSAVKALFPGIFSKIMEENPRRKGVYYNINFPKASLEEIKGIKVAGLGEIHWEEEYQAFDPDIYRKRGIYLQDMGIFNMEEPEEGEELYMMTGYPVENPGNNDMCDHRLLKEGYVAIVAHNIYNQDHQESERLRSLQVEDLHKK